ncbi:unnamed protein product [Diatraea saccharalis]|uniref:EMC1 first beta-propeller domain-containing protein n=1 Tax=Diatraea saccharalis TaxID=40085 RepID=A0A9N9QZY5_9NEOP|nr:unnamed protein product [Diatraea saccharalis]
MGMLSISIKPNFLGLLKFLNNFNWFIVFFSLINLSVCIYEDQIGKFDWRQSYVGRIKFAQFDTVSTAKRIIVATEENVLAALNLKTGQVVWRHVFESASSGNIQLLYVTEKVVTVTGSNPYLVRGWEPSTGVLLWEWSLTLQDNDQADFSEWFVQNSMLVHMLPVFGSHVEVSMYNLMTGQNRGSTSKLPAVWTNEGCILSAPYYTCISGKAGSHLLISLDVTSNAIQLISKPLSEFTTEEGDSSLRELDGNSVQPGFILGDEKIVVIKDSDFELLNVNVMDPSASVTITTDSGGQLIIQIWNDEDKGISMVGHRTTGEEVPEIGGPGPGLSIPAPQLSAAWCAARPCRLLLTAEDDALHLLHHTGRVLWTREEALANVAAAEFVDLPVSELDAAIESEFEKEGSVWGAFSRRLQMQWQQLQTFVRSLQSLSALSALPGLQAGGEGDAGQDSTELVRDYFNLHKIIVLVTDVGKVRATLTCLQYIGRFKFTVVTVFMSRLR